MTASKWKPPLYRTILEKQAIVSQMQALSDSGKTVREIGAIFGVSGFAVSTKIKVKKHGRSQLSIAAEEDTFLRYWLPFKAAATAFPLEQVAIIAEAMGVSGERLYQLGIIAKYRAENPLWKDHSSRVLDVKTFLEKL